MRDPPSKDRRPAEPEARPEIGPNPTDAPATPADVREALDRARSYAFLWLLTRDQIMRQVGQLKKDRLDAPNSRG